MTVRQIVISEGIIVKSKYLALTTSTLIALASALGLPSVTLAADTDTHTKDLNSAAGDLDAQARDLDRQAHDFAKQSQAKDIDSRDLESRLADARARLEQSAHEVAELSSQVGGEWVDKFMVYNDEGPSRAVIGVQLDSESGKDGARIQEVSPGGPADDAGLHVGDVITAINGSEVKGESSARQVMRLMRKVSPDGKVNVRVTREGKSRDVVVTARRGPTFLGMRRPFMAPMAPLPPGVPPVPVPPGVPAAGVSTFGPVIIHGPLGEMELATLTPQLGRYFGTDKGVLVVRAPKDFKLEDGDVILAIDGREPMSGSHATRILASYQPGEKVSIKVMRQQKVANVETTLPERQALLTPAGEEAVRSGHRTRMIPHKAADATT
jgi:predicted metalloprotease with PDZ domain